MKPFLTTLIAVAVIVLGWNYWAMRQARPPADGRYRSPTMGNEGRGRGVATRPSTDVTGVIRMAGGVAHSAHVDLVRVPAEGQGRVYAVEEALGDGRFTFTRVIADRYWAVARTEVDADPLKPGDGPTQVFYGLAEVVSDGEHPTHVAIQLHPASALMGRVVLQPGGASASRGFSLLTISLRPVDARARAAIATGEASAGLAADGKFSIIEVPPGLYKLDVSPSPLTVDAIVVADHDRLDRPFQVGTGERLAAAVTLTAQSNRVGGTLRDRTGRVQPFALVAVFAVDGSQREAHRRVQLIRTDAKGAFLFEGLPSGEYLLAPANGFEPTMWRTVDFFQRLTPLGQRISVGQGRLVMRDLNTAGQ
jgi:hypothetical protein